jgi:hypothetical protein
MVVVVTVHGNYPWGRVLRVWDCSVLVMLRSANLDDFWGFVSQNPLTEKELSH